MVSSNRRKQNFQDSFLLCVGVACFLVAGILNQRLETPIPKLSKQQTALNINKDLLVFLSAGNKRLITDILWVQTLIESDLEHYGGHDLNSWMFVRFNTIVDLDPYFYPVYVWGGQYLSIVKDDLKGAVTLMEKGVRYFPDDYRLNFNLGFTYYYELGAYQEGIKYLEKVMHHPKAPHFIPNLVHKMKAELGFSYDAILAMIYENMTSTKDPNLREKLTSDYHSLKAERDIKCLNSGGTNCELKDAYGLPYIKMFGKYHSQNPFVRFRLKRKGDKSRAESITTIDDDQ